MSVNALLKPRSIEVETAEGNPYSATVTMEPFETGYAHTLGNALRRVLLSSMVGFAPTEAQIAGVVHEYSQIDGVKEDVVDILLNVKGIIFKLENRDEVTITLRKEGEGVVTAADFDLPHDAQIGQSGTAVKPNMIINVAISGSVQYQVGMQNAKCIVSINHNAASPIFDISHYGAVADFKAVLPAVIAEIKNRRA